MRAVLATIAMAATTGGIGFTQEAASGMPQRVPEVEAVIAPVIKKLPAPRIRESCGGLRMAISTASVKAQEHVLCGLNLALANWDFEAYRHFCAALAEDPDCLMAHWGIGLALAEPGNEFSAQRDAAVERMAALAQRKVGSELERGYAYCLVVFYRDGPSTAGETFKVLADKYPNDPLARLLGALFGRGGYNEFGDPTATQEESERTLTALVGQQPGNPLLTYAYLFARTEAPSLENDLERARHLCQRVPDMPAYQHLLGHFEWRCGNHARAAAAFGRAAAMYDAWMKEEQVAVADCPDWVKAEAYRSVALASSGDFESALASARALAKVPVDDKRFNAPGSRLLLWEARTLPSRLLAMRNGPGDAAAALASLPKPGGKELQPARSTLRWWLQGLALLHEARKALENKNLTRARELSEALNLNGTDMANQRERAESLGEMSCWLRAFGSLEVMAAELRGDLAAAGPALGRSVAYNWYQAAADRQRRASMMMPPGVLVPMRVRVGDFLLGGGKPADAADSYRDALKEWPNNLRALDGLQKALAAAGHKDDAAEVGELLKRVRGQ